MKPIDNYDKQYLIALGKRIKFFREAKGVSQEQLAAMCNVHRTYIGMLERAEQVTGLSLSTERIPLTPQSKHVD